MADAAAKREARRRRILENSEARLQRITGQTSPDIILENAPRLLQKSSPPPKANGGPPEESPIDSWKLLSEFQDEFPSTSQENVFPSSQSNVPRRRNLSQTPNGAPQGHEHEEEFSLDQQTPFFPYEEQTSVDTEKLRNSTLISFLASRWIYVALAAVVNIMILMRLEHLFGTSIIVPFILMLITRIFLCNDSQQSQSGSMLFAALILCNIRPEIIHRLKTSSTLFFRVIRELSFYLFSFVLIYYFFTSYWHNFEGLTPNKVEIIDHQIDA